MTKPNGFLIMRIFLITGFFLVLLNCAEAQTNNSPYSILGIGDVQDSYLNRTTGLSSTGIAYRTNRSMISNNPASFSALDNQFFTGEVGVRGKYINYYGDPVGQTSNSSSDISFSQFSLGTKVTNHWGTSVGLTPFSTESYEFTSPQQILGTNGETTNSYSEGYGGIHKVYWTNAYEFFHHLSLGITGSYLFGSINGKTILQNPNAPSTYVSTERNTYYSNFYLDYGIQYYTRIGKKWDFCLGATFANNATLNASSTVIIRAIDSTILNPNAVETNAPFKVPYIYGLGISLTKNKKYSFLADYRFQNWSALKYTGFSNGIQNSQRASIGFEISKKKMAYNTLFETNYFQTGLYYSKSYLSVYGQQINDMGVTVGLGVNAKRSGLGTSFVLQYGIRGTQERNLIQERYFTFSFIFSYRDFWYTKGRKFQ
jgi:hypothetical protein